jgi:two-component system, cell cycle sensor histidine kinase and response regulator CckA
MAGEEPIVILAVDDEAPVLRLVRRFLEHPGLTIVPAGGPAAALLQLQEGLVPSLLVTDVRMPEMNGQELARRVRLLLPDLPVLFLTGYAEGLFAERSALGPNDAYLDKPFSRTGLREAAALLLFGATTFPEGTPPPSGGAPAA